MTPSQGPWPKGPYAVRRLTDEPIVSADLFAGPGGENINGPSLIAVPPWLPRPLGKFYLYFAHHHGTSIRLACADRLEGPWQPHARNPVFQDALAARPAGAFFRRDGALWRPAQDCAAYYGAGLALCRVTQLDDAGFAQKIETVLTAGEPGWPGTGLHTLNWAAGIEVVDGSRDRRR